MQFAVPVMGACHWLTFCLVFMQVPGSFYVVLQNCSKYLWHLCSSFCCLSVRTPLPVGNSVVDDNCIS